MADTYSMIPALTKQQVDRFWNKVDSLSNGCWEWQGYITRRGYGAITLTKKKRYRAHRVAYKLYYLADPGAKYVCHACDNPKCVNPLHLWLGGARDNAQDRNAKGRQADISGDNHYSRRDPSKKRLGERAPFVKLTDTTVKEIRSLAAQGVPQAEIARRFDVTKANVCCIVKRKTWTHI